MFIRSERYIESLIERVNQYTRNSLCQIEPKHELKKSSQRVEIKEPNIPSLHDRISTYKKSNKICQKNEVLNGSIITFRKYKIDIKSIFGFNLKSFEVEIFQSELEEDLSVKEILRRIENKSYSFQYFAKKYEDYVEYKAFDSDTGIVFYNQYFYLKKEDSRHVRN